MVWRVVWCGVEGVGVRSSSEMLDVHATHNGLQVVQGYSATKHFLVKRSHKEC